MHAETSIARVLQLPVELVAVGHDPINMNHAPLLEEVDLLPDARFRVLVHAHEADHSRIGSHSLVLHEEEGRPLGRGRDEEHAPDGLEELRNPKLVLLQVLHVIEPIPVVQKGQEACRLRAPVRGSEGDAQQLADRGVRGGQQGRALDCGLLHGALLTELRNENVLEVLILPNEVLQGDECAPADRDLQQLDVQLNPEGVRGVHGLDTFLAHPTTLGLLVRRCFAEHAEAALVFRVVPHTNPLEAGGLRGTGVSKSRELLVAAPQHRVEARQRVQSPLLHKPAHDVAAVELQRLEELRLGHLQALLVEGVVGGEVGERGQEPLHAVRVEVALRHVAEHQDLVRVEPAGELIALVLSAGLLLCRLRQLLQPAVEPGQHLSLERAPQQGAASPELLQHVCSRGEPGPGPGNLALGVVHEQRRRRLHAHGQADGEQDRGHRLGGHRGREAERERHELSHGRQDHRGPVRELREQLAEGGGHQVLLLRRGRHVLGDVLHVLGEEQPPGLQHGRL